MSAANYPDNPVHSGSRYTAKNFLDQKAATVSARGPYRNVDATVIFDAGAGDFSFNLTLTPNQAHELACQLQVYAHLASKFQKDCNRAAEVAL